MGNGGEEREIGKAKLLPHIPQNVHATFSLPVKSIIKIGCGDEETRENWMSCLLISLKWFD